MASIIQFNTETKSVFPKQTEVVAESAIDCIRRLLHSVGTNALQDFSRHSAELQEKLAFLEKRLTSKTSSEILAKTTKRAEALLSEWGMASAIDSKAKADEIKELLLVLAKTAAVVGNEDKTFNQTFNVLTGRLAQIAGLDDISEMRSSLVRSVDEMNEIVEQRARESRKLIAQLTEQVSTFESIAFKDDLTGLDNRRSIQERIRRCIAERQEFCVVMIDLNRFKPVNDEFGHAAGDELLRQFAERLLEVTRSNDLVGRTGGDEFVAVLGCSQAGAYQFVSRMRRSVFGKYAIHPRADNITQDLLVDASIGIAEWRPGEDADQLLRRADAAMYEDKRASRRNLS